MSRDYEELDKTLIEIEEEIEEDSSEEEILPFIYEDKFKEIDYCKNMITTIRNLDFDGKMYDKIKTIPQLYKFTEFLH